MPKELEATPGRLTVGRREKTGKAFTRKLRKQGMIPAVLYGKKTTPSHLFFDARALHAALDPAKRQNTLIALTIGNESGKTDEHQVMVKSHQVDPISQRVVHVDFVDVSLDEDVAVEVPLNLEGKPEGVRTSGGVLHQVFRTLPILCTPDKIPAEVVADVTDLGIGQALAVEDLKLSDGVKANLPPDQTLASVVAPRGMTAEEEEAAEAEAAEAEAAEGEAAAEAAPAAAEKKA